jgi:hypothetical protein
MTEHPAHELAYRSWFAAEELRGYLDPGLDFPWQLTRDDHAVLLLRMQQAVEELAAGISYISQAVTDERASGRLGVAVDGLIQVCEHLESARTPLYPAGDQAPAISSPAQLAAAGFPDSHGWQGLLTAGNDALPAAAQDQAAQAGKQKGHRRAARG